MMDFSLARQKYPHTQLINLMDKRKKKVKQYIKNNFHFMLENFFKLDFERRMKKQKNIFIGLIFFHV